ncbi:hypothetical protein [Arthrobacter sp. D2-10]
MLGRSQVARKSITLEAIDENRPLAHETLTSLADAGNNWASETLSLDEPEELDPDVTAEALARLTTPLVHTKGVYSVGTNAIGDSLLVRHLPTDAVDQAMGELLDRADDPHLGSSDRGEYLVAAANLSAHTDASKRPKFFETAVRLATSPTPSDHDKLNEQFTHKLGAVRMNGKSHDSRGQAAFLAATLADDDIQRANVRRLAYSLLGEESDYWPTRALQHLGDAVRDDLAFLAGQGWAIRSLAATLWVKFPHPEHLGNRLSIDPDVRVRRALARALTQQPETAHSTVRSQLATDPAYSVRMSLKPAVDPPAKCMPQSSSG